MIKEPMTPKETADYIRTYLELVENACNGLIEQGYEVGFRINKAKPTRGRGDEAQPLTIDFWAEKTMVDRL